LHVSWLRNSWQSATGWQRAAFLAWAVVVVAALGRAALVHSPRHAGCYDVFAQAGQDWLGRKDLYMPRQGLDVYRYSPLIAILLVPCGALPDVAGTALLRLVNLLVFVGSLYWWSRRGLPRRLTVREPAILFLLALPLAVSSLVDVQTNALTVGLLLCGVTAAGRGRWNWAALCIALACLIKGYPIALGLLLVAAYPRLFAWRFVVALAACLALPFLFGPPDYVLRQYEGWLRWGLNDRHCDDVSGAFRDLKLFLRVWLAAPSDTAYRLLQVVSAAAIACLCRVQRRAGAPSRQVLTTAFCLACGWMMLLGPATEATTYIFLAPASAWLVLDSRSQRHPLWHLGLVLGGWGIFAVAQLVIWLPGGSALHQLGPHALAGTLQMTALAVSVLTRLPPRRAAAARPVTTGAPPAAGSRRLAVYHGPHAHKPPDAAHTPRRSTVPGPSRRPPPSRKSA
jgi:hypothetical protein